MINIKMSDLIAEFSSSAESVVSANITLNILIENSFAS